MDTSYKVDKELDIRGLVCPFTYIKSKLFIESEVKSGEIVRIITDHEPASRDVPRSFVEDGHEHLATEAQGNLWIMYFKKR
ncbi:MAG: sulfurtransferase TusA family protein [Brevinematales bacterium]|nr:sulfurtransferase TusA family protein [Brevinematales bacterium]